MRPCRQRLSDVVGVCHRHEGPHHAFSRATRSAATKPWQSKSRGKFLMFSSKSARYDRRDCRMPCFARSLDAKSTAAATVTSFPRHFLSSDARWRAIERSASPPRTACPASLSASFCAAGERAAVGSYSAVRKTRRRSPLECSRATYPRSRRGSSGSARLRWTKARAWPCRPPSIGPLRSRMPHHLRSYSSPGPKGIGGPGADLRVDARRPVLVWCNATSPCRCFTLFAREGSPQTAVPMWIVHRERCI